MHLGAPAVTVSCLANGTLISSTVAAETWDDLGLVVIHEMDSFGPIPSNTLITINSLCPYVSPILGTRDRLKTRIQTQRIDTLFEV